MKKRFLVFGIIAAGILGSLHSQAQTKLTLKQCIETGLANNLDVLQSQLQMESEKVSMNQSKLNLLPNISGNASQTFSQGRSIDPYSNSPVTQAVSSSNYGLNGGVVLFNGFSLQNSIRQYSLAYQASKMEWQQMKDNLTINIILAYLQELNSEDLLVQAKNQVELTTKQVERLDALNREGAIKPSDLSDLKGQYATDQLSIINAKNTLESAKISLFQLMNVPYTTDIQLERINPENFTAKYEDDVTKIYQTALQTLALVKAVDFRKQSAQKAVRVAQGVLWPTLSFGAGASTAYSSVARQSQRLGTSYSPTTDSIFINNATKYPVYRFQDNFSPSTKIGFRDQLDNNIYTSYGFTLNIPIFNGLQLRNRLKQAKIGLRSKELIASTTRTQLNQNVNQAYINMSSAAERYTAITDQVTAFSESFHAAEIRFSEGVFNSVEYLTVKNSIDRANINLINAKYDYVLRMKILDYYEGKPLW